MKEIVVMMVDDEPDVRVAIGLFLKSTVALCFSTRE